MKKEERDILYNQKKSEGKSDAQIWKEINQLEYSQKIIFKDNEKEIRSLKKQLEKLNEKLEKERNKQGKSKDFKKQFSLDIDKQSKIDKIKSKDLNIATTRDIKRILTLLQSEKEIGLNDLTKTCVLSSSVCQDALNLLNLFKIVNLKKEGITTMIHYNL
jgi:predicted  nucleic acid-binding Zn-ribbon protein